MLNREKLRNRLDRQTARDHTRMRRWSERREGRILDGMERPVLPAFCRICLTGMLAGAFMAATGDLASPGNGARGTVLRSAAASALAMWAAFGVPLAVGCLMQLKKGFDHPWFDRHRLRRNGRLRMPWERKYRLWTGIACLGGAALLAVYIAAECLL